MVNLSYRKTLELPNFILTILLNFRLLFSNPVFKNVKILIVGAVLCLKQRTISAILRCLGMRNNKIYHKYHWVLSHAKWSSLVASRILLFLILKLLPKNEKIYLVCDDVLEKRKGNNIKW